MKAIVLNAPHDFCLQDIDDPVVSADELERGYFAERISAHRRLRNDLD